MIVCICVCVCVCVCVFMCMCVCTGLMGLNFNLSINSNILNKWSSTTVSLAALMTTEPQAPLAVVRSGQCGVRGVFVCVGADGRRCLCASMCVYVCVCVPVFVFACVCV